MFRLTMLAGLLASLVQAAPESWPARTDSYGDPLPSGAVARLGTIRWRTPTSATTQIVVSPDGKLVAAGGNDGSIHTFDFPSGRVLRAFHFHEEGEPTQLKLAFTPDSKRLVVGAGPTVTVHSVDLASGRSRPVLQVPNGICTALSNDGRWAIVCVTVGERFGRISVFDLAQRKEIPLVTGRPFEGISTFGMNLSHDGHFAAVTIPSPDGAGVRVLVCEPATGKRWTSPAIQDRVAGIAFAPDGQSFVTRGESTLLLWKLASTKGKLTFQLTKQHRGFLFLATDACFSPDGKLLITSSDFGSFITWDATTLRPLRAWGNAGTLGATTMTIAYSPDGKTILTSGNESAIRLWDAASGGELLPRTGHRSPLHWLAFSADGRSLASVSEDGAGRLWNLTSRRVPLGRGAAAPAEVRYQGRESSILPVPAGGFEWLSFAAGGKNLFGEVQDGSIIISYDNKSRRFKVLVSGLEEPTRAATVSPDGRFVARALFQGGLQVTDTRTGKLVEAGWRANYLANGVEFLPDNRTLLVLNETNTLEYWDMAASRALPPGGGMPRERGMAHRYWGCFEMATDAADRLTPVPSGVLVWEVPTGRIVRHFKDVGDVVGLSSDGRYLAFCNEDAIELIEVASAERLGRRWGAGMSIPSALEFSPDGQLLAAGYPDGTILLWDVSPPRPREPVTAERLNKAWDELASDRAGTAFLAAGVLLSKPADAFALLRKRLQPSNAPDPLQVAAVIGGLDHPRFAVREQATKKLLEMAEQVEAPLEAALRRPDASAELCRRGENVLAALRKAPIKGERLRALRATEILERIGGAEAEALLKALAKGGDGLLARSAADALERLRMTAAR